MSKQEFSEVQAWLESNIGSKMESDYMEWYSSQASPTWYRPRITGDFLLSFRLVGMKSDRLCAWVRWIEKYLGCKMLVRQVGKIAQFEQWYFWIKVQRKPQGKYYDET